MSRLHSVLSVGMTHGGKPQLAWPPHAAPTGVKSARKGPNTSVVDAAQARYYKKRNVADELKRQKWYKSKKDAEDEAIAKYERYEMEKHLERAKAQINAQQAAQREMLARVGEISTLVAEHEMALGLFTSMLGTLIEEGDERTLYPETVERRVRIARDAFSIFGIYDLWASLGTTEKEMTQRVLGWIEPPEEVD